VNYSRRVGTTNMWKESYVFQKRPIKETYKRDVDRVAVVCTTLDA